MNPKTTDLSTKRTWIICAATGVGLALVLLGMWIGQGASAPVNEIERFLHPPDRWLVAEYGFHGDKREAASLSRINTAERAAAMLRLLDQMIASTDEAAIPEDLEAALEQIRRVAPQLAALKGFQRLENLAQRNLISGSKSR